MTFFYARFQRGDFHTVNTAEPETNVIPVKLSNLHALYFGCYLLNRYNGWTCVCATIGENKQ